VDFTQPITMNFIIWTIVGFAPFIALGVILVNKFAPRKDV